MKALKKILAVLLCMVMLLGVMPVVSFGAAETAMKLDTYYSGYVESEDYVTYTFTPTATGYYRFFTLGYDDPYVEVYDKNNNYLGYDDDGGVDLNCNLTVYLTKGVKYYFYVGSWYASGFDACITRMDTAPYTGIAKTKIYEVELDENTPSALFKYKPTKSGYYAFSSQGSYDAYCIFYDSQWNTMYKNDDGGEDLDFYLDCYLEAGETYYFEAGKYDPSSEESYTVSINETAVVEDIEIVELPYDTTCYDGYVEETMELDGLKVKLTYSDGSVKYWGYYDNYIPGSNVYCDWYFDEYDDLCVEVYSTFDYECFYLDVVQNPVKSISVVNPPTIQYYENCNGYYDEYLGHFIYYVDGLDDLDIKVEYTDGSSEIIKITDSIDGNYLWCYSEQDYYPWEVGGYNTIIIEYYGVYTEIEVDIIENPVESITLNSAPTATYMYGAEDAGWLYEDGVYEFVPYKLEGLSLTINYKDGTSKVVGYDDIDIENYTIDGQPLGLDLIYADGVGEYEATLYLMGQEIKYNVTVVDVVRGDADLDGEVSVMDATAIQLYKASMAEFGEDNLAAADVDDDGEVSVLDATKIQMFKANLIDEL